MVTAVKQRAERRRELDRETSIENHQHQTRTTRRLMRSIETESNAPTMISDYLTDRSIFSLQHQLGLPPASATDTAVR